MIGIGIWLWWYPLFGGGGVPPTAILDETGAAILDENGAFILEG